MSDKEYIDPFTSEAVAGEREDAEPQNVCISCEG